MDPIRVLYLSYDGALDPLGRSQVLPYLEALSARGHRFTLLTHEKAERWSDVDLRSQTRARLDAAGIDWCPLPYHRAPAVLSTIWDLGRGSREAARRVAAEPFDLVHVRSYPCALIAQNLRRRFGLPYLFDMRGFYAEERVDGQLWPAGGGLYQTTKRLELGFLREAAAVVTLTHASRPTLEGWMDEARATGPIHVVPTAVDLDRFVVGSRPDPAHLMYLGSVGTWYMLPEMAELSERFLGSRPDARVTFLINGDTSAVHAAVSEKDHEGRLEIRCVEHSQVPEELRRATATFAFIRPAPSKIASSPTKIGESLAAGAPVLVNAGVGDVAELVGAEKVGVTVAPTRPAEYADALRELMDLTEQDGIRLRCRRVAEEKYALVHAADVYETAYEDAVRGNLRRTGR